jgi:hypothetical protein
VAADQLEDHGQEADREDDGHDRGVRRQTAH